MVARFGVLPQFFDNSIFSPAGFRSPTAVDLFDPSVQGIVD
jgi:hypothetical protein